MKFQGCSDELIHVDMFRILPVIDYITSEVCGRSAIIISTTEGRDIVDDGLAVDLCIKDFPTDVRFSYFFALNYVLRKLCDVVFKSDYIHVEYNPI